MTQFQKAAEKRRFGDILRAEASRARTSQEKDATLKAAGKLAQVAVRELTYAQKKQASLLLHSGFGSAMGTLYGMAMETSPRGVRAQRIPFFGSLFGSALFLGAEEMALPALGLSEAAESPSTHLYAWASHLVYGVTEEFMGRQVGQRI